MNIAPTLVHELAKHSIAYDVVSHSPANSSLHSANSAHIPTDKMIKPVVLEDDLGFVMALVPANQYVKIDKLNILSPVFPYNRQSKHFPMATMQVLLFHFR